VSDFHLGQRVIYCQDGEEFPAVIDKIGTKFVGAEVTLKGGSVVRVAAEPHCFRPLDETQSKGGE